MVSITYEAGASQRVYPIPFDFIEKDHLTLTIDSVPRTDFTVDSTPELTLGGTITTPTQGALVRIERITPISSPLVTFQSPSILRASELTLMLKQLLYSLQESGVSSANAMRVSNDAFWEGQTLPISNIGEPTDASDAATKAYTDNVVATGGILQAPVLDDIGKGIRIRGGPLRYSVGAIEGAVKIFRIPEAGAGPSGWLLGDEIYPGGIGTGVNFSNIDMAMPLEVHGEFLEPDGGAIELNGDGTGINLPRGTFLIEMIGSCRSLLASGNTNPNFFCGAIYNRDTSTVEERSYTAALGLGSAVATPHTASAPIHLRAILDVTTPITIDCRLSCESSGEAVVADVPFYMIVKELTQ